MNRARRSSYRVSVMPVQSRHPYPALHGGRKQHADSGQAAMSSAAPKDTEKRLHQMVTLR